MKRHTVILPFLLPRLTDAAAAQLVALLNALLDGIEHHYAVGSSVTATSACHS